MSQTDERIITHFGSGFTGPKDKLYRQCIEIGELISKNGYTVCSGGYGGTMEAVSKGAKKNDGKTLGVTVATWDRQPNMYIDENIQMSNHMERIMELIAIGDAYVIFPGGTGTLVEISTTLEIMHKKAMKEKKLIFFTSFWKNVIETLKLDSKSLKELIKRNVKFVNTPQSVLKELINLNL